ncbi:MAG TPA: TolC family protein [Gemmatimonadales bacterium]|nr:TolC family protein [Gemmatimonadales bacterium]
MRAPLLMLGLAAAPLPLAAQARAGPKPPTGPLTLLEAIALGRKQGIDAVIAELDARVSEARVGERRAALLPTVAGAANVTRQTINLDEFGFPGISGISPDFSVWRFRLGASETLFDASAITRLRAARDTAVAAGLDAQAVGELAGATAGLAYLGVLSARETVAARDADSAVAADLLDQARQLVQAGVSPAIDRTRSEVSYAAVRTQLEVSRNALDRARLDLLRTLDLPPGTELDLADSLGLGAVDIPLDPAAAARYARDHRAELRAARQRTEAARQNLKSIRFERIPSLGVSGYYQQTGPGLGNLAGTYNVQLGITVPILDGFSRRSRVKEQESRLAAQEIRERDLGNRIETEARQSVLDVASARQQAAIAEERLRLAEEELSQAQQRFQAGVAGSVETTQAQSAVIAARDALIQARLNYGTARVRAYRALGIIDQLR